MSRKNKNRNKNTAPMSLEIRNSFAEKFAEKGIEAKLPSVAIDEKVSLDAMATAIAQEVVATNIIETPVPLEVPKVTRVLTAPIEEVTPVFVKTLSDPEAMDLPMYLDTVPIDSPKTIVLSDPEADMEPVFQSDLKDELNELMQLCIPTDQGVDFIELKTVGVDLEEDTGILTKTPKATAPLSVKTKKSYAYYEGQAIEQYMRCGGSLTTYMESAMRQYMNQAA